MWCGWLGFRTMGKFYAYLSSLLRDLIISLSGTLATSC